MKEVDIKEAVAIAKKLDSEGKKWHFHMLTPDCMFNENKDKHLFIVENEETEEVLVVYSDERHMDAGKELVQLIHGKSIVEAKAPATKDENYKKIIEKATKFNEKGIHWHHHMLMPTCIFNKHKGKYCVVFEDKEENKVIESVSEGEPKDNLREIEILYYAQKK